jgi:hypothetical protein
MLVLAKNATVLNSLAVLEPEADSACQQKRESPIETTAIPMDAAVTPQTKYRAMSASIRAHSTCLVGGPQFCSCPSTGKVSCVVLEFAAVRNSSQGNPESNCRVKRHRFPKRSCHDYSHDNTKPSWIQLAEPSLAGFHWVNIPDKVGRDVERIWARRPCRCRIRHVLNPLHVGSSEYGLAVGRNRKNAALVHTIVASASNRIPSRVILVDIHVRKGGQG